MDVRAVMAASGTTPTTESDAKATRKLQPIKGHEFSKVLEGAQKGHYVNRSGNARDGETFQRVHRDGRLFHVYGEGKERTVVELKTAQTGTDAPGGTSAPSSTTRTSESSKPTTTTTGGTTAKG
ncbi:hypothetical protein [Conexibacter sp. SYSU D00693]|uniref:hypothetical protein n=1 Tax=Conexibacter sp. SYSU D00693 TaxID=2812560 RepID=UPI00196A539D|nr:hypothetical protein [Conexibacter sp. SYSU D00693]